MRGEYTYFAETGVWYGGSPPHTWGTPLFLKRLPVRIGITPTYVGSTPQNARQSSEREDHPPHTWGALKPVMRGVTRFGITPTYVGSTAETSQNDRRKWDHPHIRGEHFALLTS